MSDKLKPCPFCGGEADAAIDGEYTIIQCQSCFSRTDGNLTSEMGYHYAKEEWNTRTGDRLEQENAELREALNVLVYKDSWGNYFTGLHGDSDVTEIVKQLLNK